MASKKIKIKLTRGISAASSKQKKILQALGLRRTNSEVEQYESATINGMLTKVRHLLTVMEVN